MFSLTCAQNKHSNIQLLLMGSGIGTGTGCEQTYKHECACMNKIFIVHGILLYEWMVSIGGYQPAINRLAS